MSSEPPTILVSQGLSEEAPIIQLVSLLLLKAQQSRASDLHLEPLKNGLRVRFRIDGKLQEGQLLPKKIQNAIVSRLKIMTGSMNIAEKKLPQEGRFQVKQDHQILDIRASTMPTIHGESIVLRLLDRSSRLLELSELGLEKEDLSLLTSLLHQPDGLLLVTGPTGSGKTTTLYACLNVLNTPNCKIITVEDPVEYQISGLNQVQIHEKIGMTFPVVLRAMLRQAPNKIMLGEIRDSETAHIAMNASLTGHLIFSTLHTNDAPSAVARLEDIGIPLFLIASSVRAVIAQRLVRRLCSHCKSPTILTEHERTALQFTASSDPNELFMQAIGCSHCYGKGFQGRLGIFEILVFDEFLRHQVHQKTTAAQLRHHARTRGMRTLRDDGVCKMRAGLTTAQEVISMTLI